MTIRNIGDTAAAGIVPARRNAASQVTSDAVVPSMPAMPSVDVNDLKRAIGAVNKMLDPLARGLQFAVDESTGMTVVKLVDKETDQVLRQIPSKEMLSIARALDRVQGLLVDAKA